jgi:hypothetical protein
MVGVAMAELKLHSWPWELTRRGRDEVGEGEGERGVGEGVTMRGARPMAALFSPFFGCSREEENRREEGEKKRGKKKEEAKEKKKRKKMGKFSKLQNF